MKSDIQIAQGASMAHIREVMTMPGLPKVPAADGIDVARDGRITGLF